MAADLTHLLCWERGDQQCPARLSWSFRGSCGQDKVLISAGFETSREPGYQCSPSELEEGTWILGLGLGPCVWFKPGRQMEEGVFFIQAQMGTSTLEGWKTCLVPTRKK